MDVLFAIVPVFEVDKTGPRIGASAFGHDFVASHRRYRVDPVNQTSQPTADADGRLTIPALIPGASYRIIDYTVGREVAPQVRAEFTVRPGEALDLGDIRIEKPRS